MRKTADVTMTDVWKLLKRFHHVLPSNKMVGCDEASKAYFELSYIEHVSFKEVTAVAIKGRYMVFRSRYYDKQGVLLHDTPMRLVLDKDACKDIKLNNAIQACSKLTKQAIELLGIGA